MNSSFPVTPGLALGETTPSSSRQWRDEMRGTGAASPFERLAEWIAGEGLSEAKTLWQLGLVIPRGCGCG